MRSVVIVLFALGYFSLSAQPFKKKQAPPAVLFSVNNREVSTAEFVYLYKKNHQNPETDFTKPKVDEYLDLFINFKLKVEEARARGIDTTQAFITEFNGYKEELRKPYLPEGKMLDSLVRLTYNRLKEEVKASHILLMVKPDATPQDTLLAYNRLLEIKSKVKAGENFGELAVTYSEDPSAKVNKGELGYFTAMQMVYPFENAAYSGKPGDVVGPIKTRFGYHLVSIEDRKPSRGEVEISHIMIRTGTGDDAAKKNLAFEIYDQLKGGVSWDELCTQYSDDVNSKNNGGRLRPFGVGAMAAAPEFDRMAFALQQPGEISDPFQTAYGWHIIRLEQKIPLPSFEELAPSLKTRVQRDERVQISRQVLIERLKKDFNFQENETVKSKLFSLADSSLLKGKWTVTKATTLEIIFSLKTRKTSTQEFITYVQSHQRPASGTPDHYVKQLYEAFVENVINEEYENQLIKANPEYEMLLREYYEGILLFDIMEKEVWNRASDDSVGQREYFNNNASQYVAGERISAELYSATTAENINKFTSALQNNDSLQMGEMIAARKVRKETGTFQKADRSVFAKVEWKPGDYSVESNGMYYFVRVLENVAPGPMSFEEARAAVTADYQNYLEKNWVQQLKRKYSVKVNEKGKQEIYKQLVRK